MLGTPTSERSGPDSNEVTRASLYAMLHRLKSLLFALDVECRRQVVRQPALARIDDQETPA
jgi:hypothetical protein